jgi:hypothetical protein
MHNVYNHNHTLLGSFETQQAAQAEASFYTEQTGNAAYVAPQQAATEYAKKYFGELTTPNPTRYVRQHPKPRERVKFVVCYPSTRTAVRAFDTLKAARQYAENMVIEGFPWDFPARTAIPIISRETIAKYNARSNQITA